MFNEIDLPLKGPRLYFPNILQHHDGGLRRKSFEAFGVGAAGRDQQLAVSNPQSFLKIVIAQMFPNFYSLYIGL